MNDKVGGTAKTDESAVPKWERDRPGLVLLTCHWLSRFGLVLAITATCTWLFFMPTEIQGHVENPYKGVVLYLILPFVLFAGIGLAVAGMVLGRRRIRERLEAGVVDHKTALHRLIVFMVITIAANLLIGTQLTYRAVAYMDTPQFCGGACHVMRPEYVGHQDSTH